MDPPQIVVAGASGFVGTHLRETLGSRYRWRALTRSASIAAQTKATAHMEWVECDLFSLPQVEEAMQGADYAIYLVHSMLPSSRLVQGSFQDMDLLLADNFVRAAENAGVKHIIYLGGLIPKNKPEELSPHLSSRLEVETVLRSRSVPVTSLRAGLIFGAGGSSTQMLINIVSRLPIMVLPRWTQSSLQTVDVVDVVKAFAHTLEDESLWGGTYDIASHPEMTYRDLLLKTRAILGVKRLTIRFPYNFFGFSCLWVSIFGGVSRQLVRPLLDSLKHDLRAAPNELRQRLMPEAVPLETSIRKSIGEDGRTLPGPRSRTQKSDNRRIRRERKVRSVQRMPLPPGWSAPQVATVYGEWLSDRFHFLLGVRTDAEGVIRFHGAWSGLVLLELTPTPFSLASERRRAFYITGGILARKVGTPGRFEFRLFPERECVIAAIHGFVPRLPWYFYEWTQARIHLWVMRAFSRYLRKQTRDAPTRAGHP